MGDLSVSDVDDEIAFALKQAVESSKGSANPLLHATAALIDTDPVCANTGLAKALRELSVTVPPPEDPSTWLGVRLCDYRPVHAATVP